MKRLRVAHVALDLEAGGLETLVADLIRTTEPERFESHLVVLDFFGRNAVGLEAFASLHRAPPLPRWTMLWPAPLTRLFRAIAPDVVHTHSGVWHKASLAARHAGVRAIVHTEHGRAKWPEPWSDRWADRLAAARTDVVVAVSEAVAAQITGGIVRDVRKLRVIRNGVDTGRFSPGEPEPALRAEWEVPVDAPLIGSIGRFDPIKGYDVVLAAFAKLLAAWPDASPRPVLILAGDGPERAALEKQASALDIAGQVRFTGWRSDVVQMLRTFALFTLGSRSEGTSISLLEAMSTGCPPVVTAVGGNAAVLGPALAHRLVPSEGAESLAQAWRSSLGDAASARRDAQVARARARSHFSLEQMVREYEALYESVSRELR